MPDKVYKVKITLDEPVKELEIETTNRKAARACYELFNSLSIAQCIVTTLAKAYEVKFKGV